MRNFDLVDVQDQDEGIGSVVQETLADVTPRAAALALLKFSDYLSLIEQAGVKPTDELCTALFEELRAVCLRDQFVDPVPESGRSVDWR